MDLSKLTPAPWEVARNDIGWCIPAVRWVNNRTDMDFIAIARNAFDVQMRRGWTAHKQGNSFWVDATYDGADDEDNWNKDDFQNWLHGRLWPDPFTALVEADKWYKANVEQTNAKT